MRRIHISQHVACEGPGYIEEWIAQRDWQLSVTEWFAPVPRLPDLRLVDALIVLGGPMSVHDEPSFPWLQDEKALIRAALREGKKVMGICLGAQLLAEVLGARVYPNPVREIGWFPVVASGDTRTPPWLTEALALPPAVFHWHGETFDLPEGAVNHASSSACAHQLFTWKEQVMGIQFHYEVHETALGKMLPAIIEETAAVSGDRRWVQDQESILQHAYLMEPCNQSMGIILDHFLGT